MAKNYEDLSAIERALIPAFSQGETEKSESAEPPLPLASCLFFAYFILAKQKKVSRRRAIPGQPKPKSPPSNPTSRSRDHCLKPNRIRTPEQLRIYEQKMPVTPVQYA